MFEYFDSHSHLNLSPLKEEKDSVIKTLEAERIATITVGVDFETSFDAVRLSRESKNLFACVGLHPTDSEEKFDYEKFRNLARNEKVVAIGECGLDYFHDGVKISRADPLKPRPDLGADSGARHNLETRRNLETRQKENLLAQIELARELKLPLMIHCRPSRRSMDAYRDLLDILKNYPGLSGNSHFFAGNLEIAREFLNLGFTLSFAGPITFVPDYDRVIEYAPLDMLLSETDAPFAAPAPYRGQTCYPQYVKDVVARIALIKKLPLSDVKKSLVENACRVFNIKTG